MTGREAEARRGEEPEGAAVGSLTGSSQPGTGWHSRAQDGIPGSSFLTFLSESQNVPKIPAEGSGVKLG